jgi:hypothetical protein
MPKVEKIVDVQGGVMPLRVTRRKSHMRGNTTISPVIRIKCGCCTQVVEICHDVAPTGNPNSDTLEIGGVQGTLEQWRKILLPLLGMKI